MDGIHDLGGLQGFGPILREAAEPVFHALWEARMFALASAVPFAIAYGDDQFRPAVEAMEPAHYLRASYYEKWYEAVARLLLDSGAVSAAELAGRVPPAPVAAAPIRAAAVPGAIAAGASQARPGAAVAPRFKAGDRVTTRRHMAARHTRLPAYARGRPGRIERAHGAFLVADRNAEGDATPEALYTVVFESRDLWGAEAAAGDRLSLDLWDSYLEPFVREGAA
jgi:nitrile hydratase beta subunit